MSNKFDTADLNDIKRLLGEDIPAPDSGASAPAAPSAPSAKPSQGGDAFNLDDIIAEVSGVVDRSRAEHGRAPEPTQFTPPKTTPPAQQPEEPVEYDEPEPEDDRPARSRRREREEDEEQTVLRDPVKAMHACQRRVKSLSSRCIAVLVLGLIALYFSIAEGHGLPAPSILTFAEGGKLFVLMLIALQIIAMLVGIDVIGLGFYNLCTGKADRASLVAIGCMASILHGMTIILAGWGAYLPYSAISILTLYAAMREEKNRFGGRARAYKAVTLHESPMGVYCHHDGGEHVRRAVKTRMENREDFQRELERPDFTEQFAQVYVPIVLAASVICAIIVSIGHGQATSFFWALSAMLTIAAPLPVLCAFGKAYLGVSRRLLSEGAAIASGRAAFRLRRAKQAVLRDSDLFPSGTVTINEVRAHSGYTPEKLLSYAAGVTEGYGMEISAVLGEALREQYGRPARATNIRAYDMGGLSGEIGGDTVLVGTAAYMARMGMPVQEIRGGKGVQSGIHVVINSQPAGVILLSYHSNAQSFSALHAFARLGIRPLLATRDFNVTAEMVQKMFEMRRGSVEEAGLDRLDTLTSPEYTAGDTVCAILSRDDVVPFAQVQQSAERLSAAVRSNLILGAVGGGLGLALMFYLAFQSAFSAVAPEKVFIYMILWYIPSFFVTFHTRKGL